MMDGETTALAVLEEEPRGLRTMDHALWNPEAFLQTERVANIMVDSGLLPKALTHDFEGTGSNRKEIELSREMRFARAVLIATQARALGVDPVLFAQSCAIVHGRLMYEGKLVAAMIEKSLRLRLEYEFGLWNRDHFEPVTAEEGLWNAGERLAVRVCGVDAKGNAMIGRDGKPLFVEGSAGVWKTSQWGPEANWRQRMRYRGAREWCRAHTPGIMVGIVTIDEAEEISRPEMIAAAPSPAAALHGDFEDQAPAQEKPRRSRPPKNGERPDNSKDPEGQGVTQDGAAEGAQGGGEKSPGAEAAQGLDGDDLPDAVKGSAVKESERPLEAGPAPEADKAAPPADLDNPGAPPERTTVEGYPEPDETYHLTGDDWTFDKRRAAWVRDTYRNGEPLSAGKFATGFSIYEDHRPEGATTPAAEVEEDDDAGDEEDFDPNDPADVFINAVENAASWAEVKGAMGSFFPSEAFTAFSPTEQAAFRKQTWEFARNHSDVDDHAASPTAFRLWVEWVEDVDAIKGTLALLEKEPAFEKLNPSQKDGIRRATNGRIEALS